MASNASTGSFAQVIGLPTTNLLAPALIAAEGVEILTYQELEQNLLHVLKIAKIYQEGLSSEKEK